MTAVYLAWAAADPVGYEMVDIVNTQNIRSLPNGGIPTRAFDPVLDGNAKKWIISINIQGVDVIGFDHIGPAIDSANGRILVHAWNDDPQDFPVGMRWGVTWSFANPRIDPRVGKMNTEQYLTVWDEQGRPAGWYGESTTGGPVVYRPWSEFAPPGPANLVRHGIWISSDCEYCPHAADDHDLARTGDACSFGDCTGYASLWRRHIDAMMSTRHGWREWISGG